MMRSPVPLLLVALSATLAAPFSSYEDYPMQVPQKKAALVLDRLLIALQKALRDSPPSYQRQRLDIDGPRAAPLRVADNMLQNARSSDQDVWLAPEDLSVVPLRRPHNDLTGLQRRGQGGGGPPEVRGRVLRCYFNAITCF